MVLAPLGARRCLGEDVWGRTSTRTCAGGKATPGNGIGHLSSPFSGLDGGLDRKQPLGSLLEGDLGCSGWDLLAMSVCTFGVHSGEGCCGIMVCDGPWKGQRHTLALHHKKAEPTKP